MTSETRTRLLIGSILLVLGVLLGIVTKGP